MKCTQFIVAGGFTTLFTPILFHRLLNQIPTRILTSKTEDLNVNISTKNFLKDLHFFKRHPKQSLMLENIILNYTVKNLNFNNVLN